MTESRQANAAGSATAASARGQMPWTVLLVALLFVALELLTGPRYGLFRDEFYYLACADHLDWGYVDQPPLSIVVLAAVRSLFGDGLLAIRVVPALLGGLLVILGARLARELGGGRHAQGLAALAVGIVPQYQGIASFYSMNVFDLCFWSAALLVFARLVRDDRPALWLPLGLLLGVGLQNKISVLFLGAGIALAVVATPLRRHLARWQLWAGATLALALVSPYVLWQTRHDWATLEFMSNATRYKNAAFSPHGFLGAQLLEIHPFNAPLWVGGLALLLFGRDLRRFRALGWVFVTVLAVMLLSRSKPYYLGPAFPMLLAAGAVGLASWCEGRGRRWALAVRTGAPLLLAVGGALTAPLAVALLPVESLIAYQSALGVRAPQQENSAVGPLAQHFADRFGWREMTAAVASAYRSLSPEEQRELLIVTSNYGEAGAINYYGRELGLPRAVSQHNNFYLWGPGRESVSIVLLVGIDAEDVADTFEQVEEAGRIVAPYAMPYETSLPLLLCRGIKLPLDEAWRRGKQYI